MFTVFKKKGEMITLSIPGMAPIKIKVLAAGPEKIRLGISAPKEVRIHARKDKNHGRRKEKTSLRDDDRR